MPGPWEKYAAKKQEQAPQSAPWQSYGQPTPVQPRELGFTEPHPDDNAVQSFLRGAVALPVNLATKIDAWQVPSLAATPPPAVFGKSGQMATDAYIKGVKEQNENLHQQGRFALDHPAYTLGGLASGAVLGKIGGKIVNAVEVPEVPRIGPGGLDPGGIIERIKGYESPVIDPKLQQAAKVATAIRPASIGPDFEQTLATNLPKIKAFAEKSGNPLHSQWEYVQAAKGLAQEGLNHFNDNFLDPYKEDAVSMRTNPDYRGEMSGEGRTATIGDVNKRISDINDLIRAATKTAKTGGQKMSAMERLGLENEVNGLRQTLYRELSKRTGVPPEQIQALREGYGQQFDIADTIDASRRQRNGYIGSSQEGTNTPLSKTGIVEKVVNRVRGGKQFLADANMRKATAPIAAETYEYPSPRGPKAWMDRGAAQLKAAGVDAAKIEELRQTPEGQQLLKDSGDVAITSRRMAAIVRQLNGGS